jgi:SAM-dependent methyltransferase
VPELLVDALAEVRGRLADPAGLVRAVAAGRRRGRDTTWRRLEMRPVDLAAGRRLQVVAYDERQASTRNLAYDDGLVAELDRLLAEPFVNWHVETVDATLQLRVTKRGGAQVHRAGRTEPVIADTAHDRAKRRRLDPGDPFLRAVGVTDAEGRVKPTRRDKYRQVEEFVRHLDEALDAERLPRRPVRVVDLGCGNAYLTFAACRFLTAYRDLPVELVGVDVRPELIERNARLAAELGWDSVHFLEGTIAAAPVQAADVVLALHACDTATDEALARAVRWGAPLVLAAPCCHHDVQRQLHGVEPPGPYAVLTKHGLLRERFADVLTDTFRATLLRLLGYRVDVVQFVPTEHTPRNLLLRAVRTGAPPAPEQARDYRELTAAWGVRPHLATLLEPELAGTLG